MDDVVESFNCPADYVEPDDVVVDEVDEGLIPFPLVQVESGDKDQPEQGGEREYDNLEVVLGSPRAKSDQLHKEVGGLNSPEGDRLREQVFKKEGVDRTEE